MSLVPQKVSDFKTGKYWEAYFKSTNATFEWYGNFEQLSPVLERYLKPTDRILQIGCGNSKLAEELWDNGYRNITSIDRVEEVIRRKRAANEKSRPELKWHCMDATKVYEYCNELSKTCERMSSADQLMDAVRMAQLFGQFCQCCQQQRFTEERQIIMTVGGQSGPRYDVVIVDDPQNQLDNFAIMIVPQGRETEWVFGTPKGRLKLCQQSGYRRLAFVRLCRQGSSINHVTPVLKLGTQTLTGGEILAVYILRH